jgi:hypothetical protein
MIYFILFLYFVIAIEKVNNGYYVKNIDFYVIFLSFFFFISIIVMSINMGLFYYIVFLIFMFFYNVFPTLIYWTLYIIITIFY